MSRVVARARVSCPSCGDVDVEIAKVSVALGETFVWATTCPFCAQVRFGRITDGAVIASLVSSGAVVNDFGLVREAEEFLDHSA